MKLGYAQGIGKKVLLIYQIRDGIDPKEEIGSNISISFYPGYVSYDLTASYPV